MRVSFIDDNEAPPRPAEPMRGQIYWQEIYAVLDALSSDDRAVRITAREILYTGYQDDIKTESNFVRSVLLQVAAARGEQVDVWQGADGFVYLQTASRA